MKLVEILKTVAMLYLIFMFTMWIYFMVLILMNHGISSHNEPNPTVSANPSDKVEMYCGNCGGNRI